MRLMACTVAMISPSLLEDNRRMTSPSLEPRWSRRAVISGGRAIAYPQHRSLSAPIRGIFIGARGQLAGACCLDDVDGAVAPELCALGVERDKKMQPFAGVGINRSEQCGIGNVQLRLIDGHLCSVLRERFIESVT